MFEPIDLNVIRNQELVVGTCLWSELLSKSKLTKPVKPHKPEEFFTYQESSCERYSFAKMHAPGLFKNPVLAYFSSLLFTDRQLKNRIVLQKEQRTSCSLTQSSVHTLGLSVWKLAVRSLQMP